MNDNIKVLILAAGNGTRMKSNKPKVLHEISGKPMINHIIDTCFDAGINNISIVLGNKKELIKKFIPKNVNIIHQKKQLGTGDAIKSASKYLEKFNGKLLILYGDMPLIRKETIKNIIKNTKSNASIISFIADQPKGYGRVIINKKKGPRLAALILNVGQDKISKLLEQIK